MFHEHLALRLTRNVSYTWNIPLPTEGLKIRGSINWPLSVWLCLGVLIWAKLLKQWCITWEAALLCCAVVWNILKYGQKHVHETTDQNSWDMSNSLSICQIWLDPTPWGWVPAVGQCSPTLNMKHSVEWYADLGLRYREISIWGSSVLIYSFMRSVFWKRPLPKVSMISTHIGIPSAKWPLS